MGIKCLKSCLKWVKNEAFLILIIISALGGLGVGFLIKSIWELSPTAKAYIGLPGKLVLRAFIMILVPLVIASLATSMTAAKLQDNKRLIFATLLLFIATSTYSSVFGSFLILITKPGASKDHQFEVLSSYDDNASISNGGNINLINFSQVDTIYDLFINMIPDNIISATFMIQYTALVPKDETNLTLGYERFSEQSYQTNFLGLCVFSLLLGFAVQSLKSEAKFVKRILKETNAIIMKILMTLMKLMPIGMFSWMCIEAIKMESPKAVLTQLLWFLVTVFIAFFTQLFIFYPGVYILTLYKNPFKFYINLLPAIFVGFGSASSAFTLPMTIKCMEENNKLSNRLSRIVLPLGMTLHMNGFAMYYPMVTIFVAQMHGLEISILQIISLCFFATLMSTAMPGIPSGRSSIITFIAHCTVIGIKDPLNVLAYIMTIDWLMDRFRTITNIIGTCFVAAILQKFFGETIIDDFEELQMVPMSVY